MRLVYVVSRRKDRSPADVMTGSVYGDSRLTSYVICDVQTIEHIIYESRLGSFSEELAYLLSVGEDRLK